MRSLLIFSLCLITVSSFAQTDYTYQTFRDTRVVNGHSVETNEGGELKMIISHRFGAINGGAYEFFGLDQSTIRLGFDYGVTNNLTVGVGRSSFEKTVDGFVKYKFLHQKSGDENFPVSVSALASMAANGLRWENEERENYFSSRLFYAYQLIVARKFHPRFSLQVMPSMVHRNLVPTPDVAHDVFALGSSFRFQVTQQLSVQGEYYYTLPDQLEPGRTNSLSLGVDIETKGHVFQLHLSNSRGMIEKFFIAETFGDWLDGDIYFGFNITRDWRLTGRK